MIHSTYENPKIGELIEELGTLGKEHHGFTMAIAREADVNYNNLSSIINGKRKMGYHVYFAIWSVLPRVKREFEKKKAKKK